LFCSLLFLFVDSFGQADGAHRADKSAEVTAYAFRADDTGLAGVVVEGDGLVTAFSISRIRIGRS
jgi:hypothetical protein